MTFTFDSIFLRRLCCRMRCVMFQSLHVEIPGFTMERLLILSTQCENISTGHTLIAELVQLQDHPGFYLWGHTKSVVYQTPVTSDIDLVARIVEDVCDTPAHFVRVHKSVRRRCDTCIAANG